MDGEVSFEDYYRQFLDDQTEHELLANITLAEILSSTDKHLNDIPMIKWDGISGIMFRGSEMISRPTIRKSLHDKIHEADEGVSAATLVCIYKQQARVLKERYKNGN
jgi:hypothetical protein